MLRRGSKGSIDYTAIHERYKDTSLVIFQTQQQELKQKLRKQKKLGNNVSHSLANESKSELKISVLNSANDSNELASIEEVNDEGLYQRRFAVKSKICAIL